jgi:AraC-like DNA-binding protein
VDDNPQRTNHGLVVTHLDEAVFTRLLTAYRPGVNVYLTDGSGIVYASSDPGAFITDLSYLSQFDAVFQSASGTRLPTESGTFASGLPWDRDLMTFRRSTTSGLFVVTVIETGIIWAAFLHSFLAILLLGLSIAVLTTLIARRLMLGFYSPIEKLIQDVAGTGPQQDIDEYAVLHQALLLGDQAGRIAQEKYLFDLLTGKPNQEDAERIQHILTEFEANAYLILIGRFDSFASLAEMNAQDLDSFRFVVINVVSELLTPVGRTTGIVTGDNEVSLIVQLEEAKQPAEFEAILAEAQAQIRRFFPFTITLAWQNPVQTYADFNACFAQTRSLFNYRLFLGPNSLISPAKTATANQNIRYPVLQEKRILEALNLRRQDQLLAGIDDFMQALSIGYTPRITNYFSQLLFSVFKQVDNTADLVDDDYDNYIETNSRLIQADQLEEARQIIARFCLELMTLSQEKSRSATEQKHERLHGELVRYLEENLGDPNLSLDSTASRFNLSTGYLGKLVKASSGEAFSSLLASMRLEKAADLLVSTNQPAYKIAEQVGIPNVTYFSTLFKRQYGLSPAPFREKRGKLGEAGSSASRAAGTAVTPAN